MSSTGRSVVLSEFPSHTRREAQVDGAVHVIGVPGAVAVFVWLLWRVVPGGSPARIIATTLYGAGLIGMLSASAAYNLMTPGPAKAVARRIDHAMIYVMIAGSYTPFALCALRPGLGIPLLAASWLVASLGAGLKLRFGNQHGMAFLALYLAHGWMLLPVIGDVGAALGLRAMLFLAGGGLVYCLGIIVHTRAQWGFHNAIWHAMVLLAAGLQFVAIIRALALR